MGKSPKYDDGEFLDCLAKIRKIHVNTVRSWARQMGLKIGLVRRPSGQWGQALTSKDAKTFIVAHTNCLRPNRANTQVKG